MVASHESTLVFCICLIFSACGSNASSSNRVGFAGAPPNPTMVTPNSGPGGTTTPITIVGTALDSVSAITLLGTALPITAVSPSQINAIVPAGLSGGTGALIFTYPGGAVSNPNVVFTVLGRDTVLITEIGNGGGASNDFEFIELHNPTANPIELTNYYLTDGTDTLNSRFYWKIADNPPNEACWSTFSSDFIVRFPSGTMIQPGQFLTIGLGDQQASGAGNGNTFFFSSYGKNPDFEIRNGADDNDGITDMLNLMSSNGFASSSIGTGPGVPNSGEFVVLFHWDGSSDLVQDVDYFAFGGATTATNPEAVSKTGAAVGTSTFQNDTALANQADFPVSPNQLTNGFVPYTYQRIDFFEGTEMQNGGNGITGNDETSENYDQTFSATMPASPGLDYPANPRANQTGVAVNSAIRFQFYRNVNPGTIPGSGNFSLAGPGGAVASTVTFDPITNIATLTPSSPLTANTMYTVTITGAIQPDNGLGVGFFVLDFNYSFTTAP
jgi:hypothetical protein